VARKLELRGRDLLFDGAEADCADLDYEWECLKPELDALCPEVAR
jgi:hypothetical protein